ncbi:type II secretion protein [Halobacteriales archaeon QS_4_70_19]|nr:MAG: type II secretion protein [Halobacteriales archaeon QS_4_70_19]
MLNGLDALLGADEAGDEDPGERCGCVAELDTVRRVAEDDGVLAIDAHDCPDDGQLAAAPDCRATAVDALAGHDVRAVRTEVGGLARWYEGRGVALLVAAGRFAETARAHAPALAARARREPMAAAAAAAGRSDAVTRAAAESGLLAVAESFADGDEPYDPLVSPGLTRSLVTREPPPDAVLDDCYELDTGAVVRLYDRLASERPRRYHVEPSTVRLSADAVATLATARERLAEGADGPGSAVAAALATDGPLGDDTALGDNGTSATGERDHVELAATLERHTRGAGVIEDLFADDAVSDVFATAPVAETPLRVRRDDETMTTNVRLTREGGAALTSRFRRDSGRAFARASPTLAATTTVAGRRVRVSGVTDPVSEGPAFALRAHDREAWRLADLVANGTVPAPVAGLLSLAVERGVACLVTGERGAGKTTLLGALLWELPATTRTVIVEDTPELPTAALRDAGRDVQPLRVGTGDTDELEPAAALRTALRLGESALVVGEIRGEEARVLYEAMRVGAGGAAVLGTVHGDGAATVRERMVSDLGVPASSFADTDLLVTVGARETRRGRERRVRRVEEVVRTDGGDAAFAPLYVREEDSLVPTERLEAGESTLVTGLGTPDEAYDETRTAATDRGTELADGSEGTP